MMTYCCYHFETKKSDQCTWKNVQNTEKPALGLVLSTCDRPVQVVSSATVWTWPVYLCSFLFLEARRWGHDQKSPSLSKRLTAQTPPRPAQGNTHHYKTRHYQVQRLFPPFMGPVQPWLRSFPLPAHDIIVVRWVVGLPGLEPPILLLWLQGTHDWGPLSSFTVSLSFPGQF